MILLLQLSGPDGPVTATWIHGRSPHLLSAKRDLTRTVVSARRTDVWTWHFCRVNSSTHHDMVLRPVANNWLLSDRVSQQLWQKIQQNRTGWSEDHYSQQIKAHAFHCLVCCYWIAQNSPYPIHNIRLFAKIKSRMPSLWQIACVVKTRLQLSPSHDFVILTITK